jgi:hypothetical protein
MDDFDIYEFHQNFTQQYLQKEISFFEKSNFPNPLLWDHLEKLNNRRVKNVTLSESGDVNTALFLDTSTKRFQLKKMDVTDYNNYMDDYVYKKPWSRLREFHRIVKLREYIDSLEYDEKLLSTNMDKIKKNKEMLITQLIELLKNKELSKKKNQVLYDVDKTKIIEIGCVVLNPKTKLYDINLSVQIPAKKIK